MCGLAGAYDPEIRSSQPSVDAMLDRIAHRGPDGRSTVTDGPMTMGHVRLAILDLTDRAAQPMWSQDGRYLFAYNGETYNFADLRERLAAVGVTPVSTGDTEVLLEHLIRFGVDATLGLLEGFFAFALWDRACGVLTLARDRLGKKPLYWSDMGGVVRFASEAKALVDSASEPDLVTLESMLLGFPASWGRATAFRQVSAVEPGSIVQFHAGQQPKHRRWFSPADLVDPDLHRELEAMDDRHVLARVQTAFQRSLRYRMVSDVPVASLVSGGVDSSLVTILAGRQGYEPALYHADVLADSERPLAEAVARLEGRSLRAAEVDDTAFLDLVAAATWFNDQPLTYHVNAVPFLSVCQLAGADGVKVLLSGEGSDELFLGYPQYGLAPYLEAADATKAAMRRLAARASPRAVSVLWPDNRASHEKALRGLVSRAQEASTGTSSVPHVDHLRTRSERRAHAHTLTLIESHLPSLLHRNDRLGMAAGIENRCPFLGTDLLRLALNLPARFKLRWTPKLHDIRHPFVTDKWVVRRLSQMCMPADLATRTKQGFPVRVQDRVQVSPDLLRNGFVSEQWKLTGDAVERMLEEANSAWAFRLLLVEIWGRMYFHGLSADRVGSMLRVMQVSGATGPMPGQ